MIGAHYRQRERHTETTSVTYSPYAVKTFHCSERDNIETTFLALCTKLLLYHVVTMVTGMALAPHGNY